MQTLTDGRSLPVKAGTAIFIPVGYLYAEASSRGLLLYGMRASHIWKSAKSQSNYEALIGMMKVSGKFPTDKMEQALALMEEDEHSPGC